MSPAARADELRTHIDRHNRLYYQDATPEISDRDFDTLLDELKRLERDNPGLITPDSPTQRVGGAPIDGFKTVTHRVPMLSIENSYDANDLREFDASCRKALGEPPVYVVELKIDGVAMSLSYENGMLTTAATRGDGERGDDVTHNLRTIPDVPLKLHTKSPPALFEVRGEVYLPRSELARLNKLRVAEGEEPYANCRNTAAGSLKQLDPKESAKRKLRFFGYALGAVEGGALKSHVETLELLKSFGFAVNPHVQSFDSIDDVIAYCDSWNRKRHDLPYDTDGMVVKVDSFNHRERLGYTSKFPRWARAYKFEAEQATTKLSRIDVQVGRTGKLTPVAYFDPPVKLAGTTVGRATLHNADEIARKDVRIGDTVVVEKAGEIIPQVVRVETAARTGGEVPFEFPKVCPVCGSPTKRESGSPFVFCSAPRDQCGGQVKRAIRQFVRRDAMDVEGLGDKLIEQLVETDLVESLPDIYTLDEAKLWGLERMGKKSAANILEGIETSKGRGLARFLSGLGCPYVGDTLGDILAQEFLTIDALMAADVERLTKVEAVGPERSKAILDFFHAPATVAMIDRFRELGVKLTEEKRILAKPAGEGGIMGKTIVVTGTLESFGRKEIEDVIKKHGGKPSGSVSKKTDYLLAGAEAGSKLAKANELGVKVLTEAAFKALIGM